MKIVKTTPALLSAAAKRIAEAVKNVRAAKSANPLSPARMVKKWPTR